MFNVMVNIGGATQWQFLFRNKEKAESLRAQIQATGNTPPSTFSASDAFIDIEDDFGTRASLKVSAINGLLIEDYMTTTDAAIERTLVQARAQTKAQKKIAQDPVLKFAGNGLMPGAPTGRPF